MEVLKGYQSETKEANVRGASIAQDGHIVNIENFEQFEYITIDRIATALSRIKRYCGNSKMTVAQHCIRGAEAFMLMGKPELAYIFLHHESFTEPIGFGDIPGPVKALLGENLKRFENAVEKVIAEFFGVQYPFPPEIKIMDKSLAQDEMTCMKIENFEQKILPEEEIKTEFIKLHLKLHYILKEYYGIKLKEIPLYSVVDEDFLRNYAGAGM